LAAYPLLVGVSTWCMIRWMPPLVRLSRNEDTGGIFGVIFIPIGYVILVAVCLGDLPWAIAGVFAPEGVTAVNLLKTLAGK
jgi:hypothetical protein